MRHVLPRVLAVFFAVAGITKLVGWAPQLERFYQWQLPGWWIVYAVGVLQVLGGLGLWRPGSRRGASYLLAALSVVMLSSQLRFGYWWDALASLGLLAALLLGAARPDPSPPARPPVL